MTKSLKKLLVSGTALLMLLSVAGFSGMNAKPAYYHVNASRHYRVHHYKLVIGDGFNYHTYHYASNSKPSTLYKLGKIVAKCGGNFARDDFRNPVLAYSSSFERGVFKNQNHHSISQTLSKTTFAALKAYLRYRGSYYFNRGYEDGEALDVRETVSQKKYTERHSSHINYDRGLLIGHYVNGTGGNKDFPKAYKILDSRGCFRISNRNLRKLVYKIAWANDVYWGKSLK